MSVPSFLRAAIGGDSPIFDVQSEPLSSRPLLLGVFSRYNGKLSLRTLPDFCLIAFCAGASKKIQWHIVIVDVPPLRISDNPQGISTANAALGQSIKFSGN
jgi:hypothetical protein